MINYQFVLSSGLLLLHHSIPSTECQDGYDYAPPPANTQLRPQGGGASKAEPSGGGGGGHGHGGSGDPLDWLRESVPGKMTRRQELQLCEILIFSGEPGVDYPIFASPPDTGFSCEGKEGLYADTSAQCQAWHVCLAPDEETGVPLRQWSFLCPNGTIFNQEIFTCVWWFDFDCNSAEAFYGLNDDIYKETGGASGGGNRAPASPSRPSSGGGNRAPASPSRPSAEGGNRAPASPSRPSSSAGSRPQSRPSSGGGSRPQSRPSSGGGSRPASRPSSSGGVINAEPGLTLVIPGLEDETDLASYQADSLYGAPGGRRGRKRRGDRQKGQ